MFLAGHCDCVRTVSRDRLSGNGSGGHVRRSGLVFVIAAMAACGGRIAASDSGTPTEAGGAFDASDGGLAADVMDAAQDGDALESCIVAGQTEVADSGATECATYLKCGAQASTGYVVSCSCVSRVCTCATENENSEPTIYRTLAFDTCACEAEPTSQPIPAQVIAACGLAIVP